MANVIRFEPHAVDRYRQRFAPDLSYDEATAALAAAAPGAIPLKERTTAGDALWRLPDLGVVIVTKRDPGVTGHVCVTVLPRSASRDYRPVPQHLDDRMAAADLLAASIAADEARLADARRAVTFAASTVAAERDAVKVSQVEKARPAVLEATARTLAAVKVERAVTAKVEPIRSRLALAHIEMAIVKEECKTIRHALTTDETISRLKGALRLAMRALHGEAEAADAIAGVVAVDPGLGTRAFWAE